MEENSAKMAEPQKPTATPSYCIKTVQKDSASLVRMVSSRIVAARCSYELCHKGALFIGPQRTVQRPQ